MCKHYLRRWVVVVFCVCWLRWRVAPGWQPLGRCSICFFDRWFCFFPSMFLISFCALGLLLLLSNNKSHTSLWEKRFSKPFELALLINISLYFYNHISALAKWLLDWLVSITFHGESKIASQKTKQLLFRYVTESLSCYVPWELLQTQINIGSKLKVKWMGTWS